MENANDPVESITKTKKRKNFLWTVNPEWISALLQIMCEFVDANLKSAPGFKDAVYQGAAKKLRDKFGVDVSGEQCKNQVSHQRSIWSHIQRLRRKSGVSWDEQRKMILMGYEEYTSHIQAFPKDAAYLNIPIANYCELEKVCGEGHATGDWAKASNSSTPLGVENVNFVNEENFSFMDTEVDLSQSLPDWSSLDPSGHCTAGSETETMRREASSASKSTTSKRRSIENDRSICEYVALVAKSVSEVANAIKNHTSAKVAQERVVFTELMTEMLKTPGFTEDEVYIIYDSLCMKPSLIQPFLSKPEEAKVMWMRKELRNCL